MGASVRTGSWDSVAQPLSPAGGPASPAPNLVPEAQNRSLDQQGSDDKDQRTLGILLAPLFHHE